MLFKVDDVLVIANTSPDSHVGERHIGLPCKVKQVMELNGQPCYLIGFEYDKRVPHPLHQWLPESCLKVPDQPVVYPFLQFS